MEINPQSGQCHVLLSLPTTDLVDRNALHAAMKQGIDVALAYLAGEDGPVYAHE